MARRSILLGVAFLIAAFGTTLVVLYVQGIEARATAGQDLVEVLVATDTIDVGESVSDAQDAGKLEKTQVLRDDLVDGALVSTASIEGEVALGTVYPGQQILAAQFGDVADASTLEIPEGTMAISVELSDPARVAGFVEPGSDVVIFASADPEIYKRDGTTRKLSPYTGLLLPKVEVIGVGTTSVTSRTTTDEDGQQTTEEVPRTILTIAVTQEQAEKVIYAARNGDLSFALRTDDTDATEDDGVTATDVLPGAFGARS
ncbi:Flp pilus assembly protein CpaB [Nocardioides sp. GY 10127]|uniref:Flp pilus assembly protein CpaB n=1 Tax=Nocardioides sp. GY 10127 TaxID=2569762 RepID=UPI0010A8A67D|nr:Flp pilus assembly protein CpaB [Nocardioides sp. GY 10127]TIC84133.1 Flp pilus assembly protein CpaB [Nocardioides sp. GY 10127]